MRCCWRTASHCGWRATSGRVHCSAMHWARAMKLRPAQLSCGVGMRTGSGAGCGEAAAAASTAGAAGGGACFLASDLRGLELAGAAASATGAAWGLSASSNGAKGDGEAGVADEDAGALISAAGVGLAAASTAAAAGSAISWLLFRWPHQAAASTNSTTPSPNPTIHRPLLMRARGGAGIGVNSFSVSALLAVARGASAEAPSNKAASPAPVATGVACGQAWAILRPQPLQNLAASRFSAVQAPHSTVTTDRLSGNGDPLGLVHHALGNDCAQGQCDFQCQRGLPIGHFGKADGGHAPQQGRASGDDVGRTRQP